MHPCLDLRDRNFWQNRFVRTRRIFHESAPEFFDVVSVLVATATPTGGALDVSPFANLVRNANASAANRPHKLSLPKVGDIAKDVSALTRLRALYPNMKLSENSIRDPGSSSRLRKDRHEFSRIVPVANGPSLFLDGSSSPPSVGAARAASSSFSSGAASADVGDDFCDDDFFDDGEEFSVLEKVPSGYKKALPLVSEDVMKKLGGWKATENHRKPHDSDPGHMVFLTDFERELEFHREI